jgi:membrane-bound ClpP family serine protease
MIILQMNTPGGLDHSMREINRAILDAHVENWGRNTVFSSGLST